jgi:ABC-type transport system involved in multi-copper enzyme maturation permease subunit
MMPAIKSDLRKLYTLRSTYLFLLAALAIIGIFAFWVEGYKAGINSLSVHDSHKLATLIRDAITNLAGLGGLVAILLMTHEYRYNTINYTLSLSRSRSQTLLSKVITVSIFALFFTVFVTVFSVAAMYLGIAIQGASLSHQVIPMDLIWRTLFVGWGYAMTGLLLATIIRQQVGVVVAFLFLPGVVESLLGLVLKDNRTYLPFTALQQVTGLQGDIGLKHLLSHGEAALVFMFYLVIGWIIAWYLFLRRDAN